mmetsp:Transcript_121568/g.211012  ORF Transcript_121568/g.211012 Transcript_121568/m.211012 type:complete len:158 (+) Transcript_121568:216-689(+)
MRLCITFLSTQDILRAPIWLILLTDESLLDDECLPAPSIKDTQEDLAILRVLIRLERLQLLTALLTLPPELESLPAPPPLFRSLLLPLLLPRLLALEQTEPERLRLIEQEELGRLLCRLASEWKFKFKQLIARFRTWSPILEVDIRGVIAPEMEPLW